MILHFARALAVRQNTVAAPMPTVLASATPPASPVSAASGLPRLSPVRVQPGYQPTPAAAGSTPLSRQGLTGRPLSIRRDPSDGRRTVIAGRFADVCAALDRMAMELELETA